MSDRTNRDKGRKVVYQHKYKRYCGCWHCEEGAYKRRTIMDRNETKQKIKHQVRVDIETDRY